jgi:hypothetical protein
MPDLPMARRFLIFAALLLLLLGGAAWIFYGLGEEKRAGDDEEAGEATVSPPPRVTVQNGLTVLTLNAATQRNGGIETARPQSAPAEASLVAYGTVLDAALLTDLDNNYLDAQTKVQTAVARLAVSGAAFERAQMLHSDPPAISTAQLENARGTYQVDQASLVSAQSRLTTLAASALQAWGPVIGRALIDQKPLVTSLVEHREYLVKVTLSPGLGTLSPPEMVSAKLVKGPDIELRFVSKATATEPKLQGASYFYISSAETGLLPGLNVIVSWPRAQEPQAAVVPESAVIWLQGKAWVYVRTGPETFVRREVSPDLPGPDGGYIVSGLAADTQVAVRGAQMLLSEEFRAQVRGDQDLD